MDLTRDQPIPLYYQLKTLLAKEILSGAYGTDGRLPTEHELCERFGLSRTPVTRALTDLAAEGAVLRRRRHGTFVNPRWLRRQAALASRAGATPGQRRGRSRQSPTAHAGTAALAPQPDRLR
jgi:DNA-binding GntR family transcriptional regulator